MKTPLRLPLFRVVRPPLAPAAVRSVTTGDSAPREPAGAGRLAAQP